MKFLKRIHPTLFSMWVVMLGCGVVMQVLILLFAKRRLYYSAGAWIGVLLAVVLSAMLLHSINGAVDRGEKGAAAYAVGGYFLRLLVLMAVFVTLALTKVGSPITAFLGVFSMKPAAYLQGFVQKIPFIEKIIGDGV